MLLHRVNDELLDVELEAGPGQPDRHLAFRILNELHITDRVEKIYITFTKTPLDNEGLYARFTNDQRELF